MQGPVDLEALVARELRRAIATDGRSLNAVGRAAGFSKGYLSQLLRGRQDLKLQHVVRVLEVLEVHPSAFLRRILDSIPRPSPDAVRDRLGSREAEGFSNVRIAPATDGAESSERQWIEEGVRFLHSALRQAVREAVRQELPRESVAERVGEKLGSVPLRDAEVPMVGSGLAPDRGAKQAQDPIERVDRQMGLGERELEGQMQEARAWVREIVQLDQDRRLSRIEGARSRFRGSLFGVLLLEEARRAIPEKPAESLSLAEAALVSCQPNSDEEPDPEVQAPALAVRGNAKRALGRLREAEQDLVESKRVLDSADLGDLGLQAEIDRYFGSLRKDQRRLEEAAEHLRRAGTAYGLLEEPENAARVLLILAAVHFRASEFDAALAASEEALRLVGEDSDAWLRAGVHYNHAYFLHTAGRLEEAERELSRHASLITGTGDYLDFRFGWLRARIAWSRQEIEKAGALFEETLGRARERGIPYDTSLLCLELALVRLAEGRTEEVRELAAEAFGVFAEEDVEPEVRTALALIEEAARRDGLTLEMLERTVAALERAHAG